MSGSLFQFVNIPCLDASDKVGSDIRGVNQNLTLSKLLRLDRILLTSEQGAAKGWPRSLFLLGQLVRSLATRWNCCLPWRFKTDGGFFDKAAL